MKKKEVILLFILLISVGYFGYQKFLTKSNNNTGKPVAYLAGPDVFNKEGRQRAKIQQEICNQYNIDCIFPLDIPISNYLAKMADDPLKLAHEIFVHNLDLLECSDIILADLTPFRGPSMDVGTAYELGYMSARKGVIMGYHKTEVAESNDSFFVKTKNYLSKLNISITSEDLRGIKIYRDSNGYELESYGLLDNIMNVGWTRDTQTLTDFTRARSFEDAVREVSQQIQSNNYTKYSSMNNCQDLLKKVK